MEIYTLFLAFANNTVCSYALGYSMPLLEIPQRATDWGTSIEGIASLTPRIKQFSWLIAVARRIPKVPLISIMPSFPVCWLYRWIGGKS